MAGNLNAIFNLAGTRLYTLVAYLGFWVSAFLSSQLDVCSLPGPQLSALRDQPAREAICLVLLPWV